MPPLALPGIGVLLFLRRSQSQAYKEQGGPCFAEPVDWTDMDRTSHMRNLELVAVLAQTA